MTAVVPVMQTAAATMYESEPNDNPATADPMSVNTWMEGNLKDTDDEDWYTFTITAPGVTWLEIKPTITNTYDRASWYVNLQDANRRNLRSFYTHSRTDYKLGLIPGKYYIKVYQSRNFNASVSGAYDLTESSKSPASIT